MIITCHKKHLYQRCQERRYSLEEVMPCVVAQDGDMWTIDTEHPAYPRARPEDVEALMFPGPGTELKHLLSSMGIHASPTCKCNKMAKKMNAWGWEESLKHIDEIVDVMEETAKKRGLPFLRLAGEALVRLACRRARKKGSSK